MAGKLGPERFEIGVDLAQMFAFGFEFL